MPRKKKLTISRARNLSTYSNSNVLAPNHENEHTTTPQHGQGEDIELPTYTATTTTVAPQPSQFDILQINNTLSILQETLKSNLALSRGNPVLLSIAMNMLFYLLVQTPGIKLQTAAKIVETRLKVGEHQLYGHRQLQRHFYRVLENPHIYDSRTRPFPISAGRPQIIPKDQINLCIEKFGARCLDKSKKFSQIRDFVNILREETDQNISESTALRHLKSSGFTYGPPRDPKRATRYHDSPTTLEDRISFICTKLWFLSWQILGQCKYFVHDESWIHEQPSASMVWSSDQVITGTKRRGHRFAFAGLWHSTDGLISKSSSTSFHSDLTRVRVRLDELFDMGAADTIDMISDTNSDYKLSLPEPISVTSHGEISVPDPLETTLFLFKCLTAGQNKNIPLQMNSPRFYSSLTAMLRYTHGKYSDDGNLPFICQIDNATYHSEAADSTLANVKNVYWKRKESTDEPTCMLYWIKKWNIRPLDTTDAFFTMIPAPKARKSKKKSNAQNAAIQKQYDLITEHKQQIKACFQTSKQYRHRKRKIQDIVEDLGSECNRPMKALFGPKGHSELAEIEYSWNFQKRFTTDRNPLNNAETKALLRLSVELDIFNTQSWNDMGLINLFCYIEDGYWSEKLLKTKWKQRSSILQKFSNIVAYIEENFIFSLEPPPPALEYLRSLVVGQKSLAELADLV